MKRLAASFLLAGFVGPLAAFGVSHSIDYRYVAPRLALAGVSASVTMEENVLQQVRIPAAAAPSVDMPLAVGDRLALSLFDGAAMTLKLVERVPSPLGNETYLAEAAGYAGVRNAVVVRTAEGLQVDIQDYENRRVYTVSSSASGVVVKESQVAESPNSDGKPLEAPRSSAPRVSAEKSAPAVLAATTDPVYVDMLIAYDASAASWARANGGGLSAFAEVQVQKMNTAIANTGLDAYYRFRLVGTCEVGSSAYGRLDYALQAAREGMTLNGVSWAGIRAKRDEVNADIVCVLSDGEGVDTTNGLGYSLRADSEAFAEWAYSACLIRAVANGYTMAHEVGHNMGAGHSDMMSDVENRGPQYHSYSSGYYFKVGSEQYYTIMAYNYDGYGNYYKPVPFFSSPEFSYLGTPVGDATHDNTRTLRQTFLATSRYRGWVEEVPSVGAAIGASAFDWETGGDHPWFVTTETSREGGSCARSCELDYADEESWLKTSVTGPSRLSFDYILRSPGGTFAVTCDGAALFSRGGESISAKKWESTSVDIPAGTHVIRFSYTHTGSYWPDTLGNGVWLDKVVFAGATPPDLPEDPEEPDDPTDPGEDEQDAPLSAETAKSAQTYNGLVLTEGQLTGTLQVTTAKAAKDGKIKVKATLIRCGAKTTLAGTLAPEDRGMVTLTGKGVSLNVRLGESGLTGSFDGAAIVGSRNTLGEKASAGTLAAFKGGWTVVFSARENAGESFVGYLPLSLTVGAKGAVKATGVLPDGAKVSASTTLIVDSEGLGRVGIDVPLYSKKGSFSAVLVLTQDGTVDVEGAPVWDTTGAKGSFSTEMTIEFAAGASVSAALFDGDYAFSTDGSSFGENVIQEALPKNVPLTVARGKITVPKAGKVTYKNGELLIPEGNPAGLKLTYTAKTSALKGSFNVYCLEKGKLKSYSATIAGYVVGDRVFASATVKKLDVTASVFFE